MRSLQLPLFLLLLLVGPLPARAYPLPNAHASQPCRGRAEPGASWTRYVDGFIELTYDLDLQSDGSRLSKLVQLRYDDGTVLYVDIDDIRDDKYDEDKIASVPSNGRPAGERLRGKQIQHAYEGSERRVLHGRAIRFKRDGRVLVMSGGQRERHREEWFTVELDPAFHDEPVPAFGHWESLIRRRPLPYTLDSPS